ncbi:MAG TPA: DEAD/DEAH box helicase [Dissulfurispiraceae bacterium]|nr:DEAD/DEAH box helicase [Dissulfurispiraceae bacterium]
MKFSEFNLHPHVASGVTAAGYATPTPIQASAIPPILQGRDVMGLAQTGTGKTAAFMLPILHRLIQGGRRHVRALIIAPTRELAEQIHESAAALGQKTGLRSATVYGGVGFTPQVVTLKRGVEIIVACPGRLLDHVSLGTIDLSRVEVLVLDEADHMFDMGFLPDIRRILALISHRQQTLLFSATMPDEIRNLANDALRHPITIDVGRSEAAVTVSHALYPVPQHLKASLLLELLRHTDTDSVLIFTRTKHRTRRLSDQLAKAGHKVAGLQGDLSQSRRRASMNGFRDGTYQILVATDIAARGIDVSQISHVINYDIPNTTDAYIHRIGRTGRAAQTGDAYTLVTPDDSVMVRDIEKVLGSRIERRLISGFDYTITAPPAQTTRTGQSRRPTPAALIEKRPEKVMRGTPRKSSAVSGKSAAAMPLRGNRQRKSGRS